jgi:ADP-ribose pyrophosphatase YjhB (NUDIX family)
MDKRNSLGQTEEEFLRAYDPAQYEKPSVTVDLLVMGIDEGYDNLKILLIKRREHPFIDCWALPGGFIRMDESGYRAAGRELEEETGLKGIYLEQIYTFTQPGRDPRMRVIDIAYLALIPVVPARAGDDAKDARWFNVRFESDSLRVFNDEIGVSMEYSLSRKVFRNGVVKYTNFVPSCRTEERLAFDHVEILLEGLMSLRSKVENTDMAFNLVPETFTLPDLQRVYELILGKEVYKANFRDKICEKVEETGEKGKSVTGNKMSQLYRYKFRES